MACVFYGLNALTEQLEDETPPSMGQQLRLQSWLFDPTASTAAGRRHQPDGPTKRALLFCAQSSRIKEDRNEAVNVLSF